MREIRSVLMLVVAVAVLVLPGPDSASAAASLRKQCSRSPDNVPRALVPGADTLRNRISIVDGALVIEGTPGPDHILIRAAAPAGWARVAFDGIDLGRFGPVARIIVRAGDGDDVVVVEPQVTVPARLEGGPGNDCLQGGSGPDVLFGGDGDDTLIGTQGRDALHAGPGNNRAAVAGRMGEIRVARSAEGPLLRHLALSYTLRGLPLGAGAGPGSGSAARAQISPMILGPPDLLDPRIAPLLRQAYEVGEAVAVTNATRADAAALRALLGHPAGADGPADAPAAALVFFRRVPRPASRAADFSTGIVLSPRDPLAYRRDPHPRTTEFLSRVFAATAIVPEPPRDSPENNLLQLASSYESSVVQTDSFDNHVQLTNWVWNVRSFDQGQDLYYVLQEVDYYWSNSTFALLLFANASAQPSVSSSVIQTSPASTQCTTSTTSGVSYTAGTGIGWNETQGLNATLTGGVSIANSQTITCPQTGIVNQTNPGTGEPAWTYLYPAPSSTQLQTFYNQWIWMVPFENYSTGQSTMQISSNAELCYHTDSCPNLTGSLQSTIPLPFGDVFALGRPTVLSVTPTCANAGTTFTIAGTGMYPSLVKNVLIDGSPLDPGQYTTVSDTALRVVAPEVSGSLLPVVVQTAQGDSNDNVTIEISVIDLCDF